MTQERLYAAYIMTNIKHTVLYTGVTNNLQRRVWEHKNGTVLGFTSRYRCQKLVWYATTQDVQAAIAKEKQIKAGSRAHKLALIEALNPDWNDLAGDLP